MAPVRLKNLVELRINVNLVRGRQGETTLTVPENEVKNGVPMEVALPRLRGDNLDECRCGEAAPVADITQSMPALR